MEFISGYREEILDLADLLSGWFRKFSSERGSGTVRGAEARRRLLEAQVRRLPPDPVLWVLHLLHNRTLGFSVCRAERGPSPGRLFGEDPPLRLRDLEKYIGFVSLEEEEAEEDEEDEEDEEEEEEAGAGPGKKSREGAGMLEGAAELEEKEDGEEEGEEDEEATTEEQEARAEDGRWEEAKAARRRRPGRDPAPLRLSCLLLVTDEHGTILGIDLLIGRRQGSGARGVEAGEGGTESLAPRAYGLLCHSMICPMGAGEPRRPRQLTVGDAHLHRDLGALLPRIGVKLAKAPMRTWGPRPSFTFASLRARVCHVCHRHSFEVKLTPCPHCGAVLYCGESCIQADWHRSPEDVSHQFWCPRLAQFMGRAAELASLPFTYTAETTRETFNKEAFLINRGLTRGYWTQLSMLLPAPGAPGLPHGDGPHPGPLLNGDPYQLLQGDGCCLMPPMPTEAPRELFDSWQEYYAWRGLDLDSPLAALLTFPLTAYHIITRLVPQFFPKLNIQNKRSLKIHVVEAGKEFDLIMVFWELSVLLPHVALELWFVGDTLPTKLDHQHFTLQRDGPGVSVCLGPGPKEKGSRRDLQIKVSARPYHLLQGPKPDLVIGFNAGFGLKDTWLSSLPRLQSLRVPAFFTESSEYSCAMDEQTMAGASGGGTSVPCLNPFRSPFRLRAADNCMPWYSNAFIFHLVYKPPPAGSARPGPAPAPAPAPAAPPAPDRRRRMDKKASRGPGRRRK
ncbi:zinc finger MYND domain-containing protein 15 isoform X2 [Tachyglossus aculeatus]|uniref:zinc finger MYND domain-containing protein 15 isoform X2 n=1 Tax=Tachyglossus aculeatus TaxID=9261 RepID=UPI0018F70008|nr:zinc finger MYND domain-containing protein 15 isoform X2 [Tachyglossus aculeatus]